MMDSCIVNIVDQDYDKKINRWSETTVGQYDLFVLTHKFVIIFLLTVC